MCRSKDFDGMDMLNRGRQTLVSRNCRLYCSVVSLLSEEHTCENEKIGTILRVFPYLNLFHGRQGLWTEQGIVCYCMTRALTYFAVILPQKMKYDQAVGWRLWDSYSANK